MCFSLHIFLILNKTIYTYLLIVHACDVARCKRLGRKKNRVFCGSAHIHTQHDDDGYTACYPRRLCSYSVEARADTFTGTLERHTEKEMHDALSYLFFVYHKNIYIAYIYIPTYYLKKCADSKKSKIKKLTPCLKFSNDATTTEVEQNIMKNTTIHKNKRINSSYFSSFSTFF